MSYPTRTEGLVNMVHNAYRNPKNTRNWFWYETFYNLFEFKFCRHEERERDTQFLTILSFPSDLTTCGTPLQTTSPNLNLLFFFFKSPNPQPIVSGHDVIHIPSPISYLGFLLWLLRLSHPPRVRVNTCTQCVHLTKPCIKPKGSQPN